MDKFDEKLEQTIMQLEKTYPQYDRLPEFKMIGFAKNKNTGNSQVPVYIKTWIDNGKYSPENVRKMRAKNGVGRPPKKRRIITDTLETGKYGVIS